MRASIEDLAMSVMHFYDYAHLILGPLSNSYCLESKLNAKALSKKIFDLDLQKKPMVSIELPNQFICDSLLFATLLTSLQKLCLKKAKRLVGDLHRLILSHAVSVPRRDRLSRRGSFSEYRPNSNSFDQFRDQW